MSNKPENKIMNRYNKNFILPHKKYYFKAVGSNKYEHQLTSMFAFGKYLNVFFITGVKFIITKRLKK